MNRRTDSAVSTRPQRQDNRLLGDPCISTTRLYGGYFAQRISSSIHYVSVLDFGCHDFMSERPFIERRRSWNAGLREHFRQLEESWNRAHPAVAVYVRDDVKDTQKPHNRSRWVSEHELKILETTRVNLLLIGLRRKTTIVLRGIEESLAPPVLPVRAGHLVLPERAIGTLVIHDVDHLSDPEQDMLNRWMVLHPGQQVIATASGPLFPLVARNRFSDVLFYRLNTLTVIVGVSESWRCSACQTPIEHNVGVDKAPRAGQLYRCPICRLDLVWDSSISKLMPAPPLEDEGKVRDAS